MSNYAVFFDYGNKTYRLPTNSEQIEISSTQAIEKYNVLKLGQIAIPTHMELKEYSFECEFPSKAYGYVETKGRFKDADYYLKLFGKWRADLVPVRFIASNGIGDDINTLVLIEELNIVEKAGQEGDKYVTFKLLGYKIFGKKSVVVKTSETTATVTKKSTSTTTNPNNSGTYIVKAGDCLWNIAKVYYGDGSKYMKIYDANKGIIKNPGLIYPGQKLVIPS